MTDDRDPNPPPTDPANPAMADADADSLRNAVGAYLLDALPEAERGAFEAYAASAPDAQAELRELAPVVALLPKLLDLSLGPDPAAGDEPNPDLRERVVSAARAEGRATAATGDPPAAGIDAGAGAPFIPIPSERDTDTPPAPTPMRRPQGRIRSGLDAAPDAPATPTAIRMIRHIPTGWLAAAVLTVVAVGAILWALALQGRIDSKNREITAQAAEIANKNDELADLRQNTATTYSLASNAATGRTGTLLYSPKDKIGVLYVHALPTLSPDRVYQLWYLDDAAGSQPRPGGTFTVDADGNGYVPVASDVTAFDAVALTTEPEGGSKTPTSDVVLSGRVGGAAG